MSTCAGCLPGRLLALLLVAALGMSGCGGGAPTTHITVFAASSLTDAFGEIGDAFEAANADVRVEFNFAGSPTLRTQLREGARADVLATADQPNMNAALEADVVIDAGVTFARNELAVIVPSDNPGDITSPYDLARPGLRLVLADEEVPVGRYARQSLDLMAAQPEGGSAFVDDVLANLVSEQPNVKAVVTAVQLGEADAGIVYVTDVTPDVVGDIEMIDIPDDVNVIASYPIAVTTEAGEPELARAFIDFVRSDAGQAILEAHGFRRSD